MMLILGKLGDQDRALVLLEEAHWNASNSPWPNRFGRGFFGRDCGAASAVWVLLAQWFAFCCSCVGGAAVSRLSGVRSITESMDVAW